MSIKAVIIWFATWFMITTFAVNAQGIEGSRFELGAGATSMFPQGASKRDIPSDFFGCTLFATYNFAETPLAVGLETSILAAVFTRWDEAFQELPTSTPDLKPTLTIWQGLSYFQHGIFRVQTEPTWFQIYADAVAGFGSVGNLYNFARQGQKYNLENSATVTQRFYAFDYGVGCGFKVLMPEVSNKSPERRDTDRRYLLSLQARYMVSTPTTFLERTSLNYDGVLPAYKTKTGTASFLWLQLSAVFPL